jgi:hypothetical protein
MILNYLSEYITNQPETLNLIENLVCNLQKLQNILHTQLN